MPVHDHKFAADTILNDLINDQGEQCRQYLRTLVMYYTQENVACVFKTEKI